MLQPLLRLSLMLLGLLLLSLTEGAVMVAALIYTRMDPALPCRDAPPDTKPKLIFK